MPRQERKTVPRRLPDEPVMIAGRVFETSWIRALAILNHAMHDQISDTEVHSLLFQALQNTKREYFATYPPPRPAPPPGMCVVCHVNPVCPEDGQDTCDFCVRRI